MIGTRPMAVAGTFYPADPGKLQEMLARDFATAGRAGESTPSAVIAPHAGFVYSGAVAATAFAPWRGLEVARVVVIGPSHRVGFDGIATSGYGHFASPLGEVRVDVDAVRDLEEAGLAHHREEAHAREHSIETHLPFLQRVVGEGFRLVPLVTGRAPDEQVEEILERLDDGETVFSISSDLSHFFRDEEARRYDRATADAIEALDASGVTTSLEGACGGLAIRGLLRRAARREWTAETLELRTSADAGGDRDRVVGYGAFVFR